MGFKFKYVRFIFIPDNYAEDLGTIAGKWEYLAWRWKRGLIIEALFEIILKSHLLRLGICLKGSDCQLQHEPLLIFKFSSAKIKIHWRMLYVSCANMQNLSLTLEDHTCQAVLDIFLRVIALVAEGRRNSQRNWTAHVSVWSKYFSSSRMR